MCRAIEDGVERSAFLVVLVGKRHARLSRACNGSGYARAVMVGREGGASVQGRWCRGGGWGEQGEGGRTEYWERAWSWVAESSDQSGKDNNSKVLWLVGEVGVIRLLHFFAPPPGHVLDVQRLSRVGSRMARSNSRWEREEGTGRQRQQVLGAPPHYRRQASRASSITPD